MPCLQAEAFLFASHYSYCLETARENFSDQIETEESLRTLATTLFIATQRHFGL